MIIDLIHSITGKLWKLQTVGKTYREMFLPNLRVICCNDSPQTPQTID